MNSINYKSKHVNLYQHGTKVIHMLNIVSLRIKYVALFVVYLGFRVGCEQSELAWIQGINKWNKMKSRGKAGEGKLALHVGSKSHAAALERYLNYKVKENHVDLMLDSRRQQAEQQREAVFKHNCKVISILIDISRFLVRQSLAFRGRSGYEEGIPEKRIIYGFS